MVSNISCYFSWIIWLNRSYFRSQRVPRTARPAPSRTSTSFRPSARSSALPAFLDSFYPRASAYLSALQANSSGVTASAAKVCPASLEALLSRHVCSFACLSSSLRFFLCILCWSGVVLPHVLGFGPICLERQMYLPMPDEHLLADLCGIRQFHFLRCW